MNFSNLECLIGLSHGYQYKEIGSGTEANENARPRLFFIKKQWLIIFLVLLWLPLSSNGFPNDFSGYAVSGLSLFAGILFTFVVTLYQKFDKINWDIFSEEEDLDKNTRGRKLKNYFKKVTVLSLYSILLSLLCIVLLGVSMLFDGLHLQVSFSKLYFGFYRMDCVDFGVWISVLLHRGATLYFLLDLVLMITYITSAIFDFFISEYDKIKL